MDKVKTKGGTDVELIISACLASAELNMKSESFGTGRYFARFVDLAVV